jgi:hypothetical protein
VPGSVRTPRSVAQRPLTSRTRSTERAYSRARGSERHPVDWQRKFTVDTAASVLIVLFDALGLGSGERGGRTRPQKGESQHNTPTTLVLHVCASQSRFQPITRDLGSCRKRPGFALSRRQHGFEPRWGHKIKVALTRSNTSHPRVRYQPHHELRERAGSRTVAAALQRPPRGRFRSSRGCSAFAAGGPRRLEQLRSKPAGPCAA